MHNSGLKCIRSFYTCLAPSLGTALCYTLDPKGGGLLPTLLEELNHTEYEI